MIGKWVFCVDSNNYMIVVINYLVVIVCRNMILCVGFMVLCVIFSVVVWILGIWSILNVIVVVKIKVFVRLVEKMSV